MPQGVKLSDKRTVDSLSLQPGHFLVAVQTQKRADSAPAPLQLPNTSMPEASLAAQPAPSAPAAQQLQQAAAPAGATAEDAAVLDCDAAKQRPPSECNAVPKQRGSDVGTSTANGHSASANEYGSSGGGFLSAMQQPECSGAFPATLLPGYTSRPEASPPATPPRQVQNLPKNAPARHAEPLSVLSDPGLVLQRHVKQQVWHRKPVPGLRQLLIINCRCIWML